MSQVRVDINYATCQGIGFCEGALPDVFYVGDDGHSHLHDGGAAKAELAELEQVALDCPTRSIRVIPGGAT